VIFKNTTSSDITVQLKKMSARKI